MAYIEQLNNQQDNNKDDSQEKQLGSSESSIVGGQQGQSVAQSKPAKGPTSSGRFTNLQKYVKANQNFAKDQGGFGGVVGSEISKVANPYKQKVQQASGEFQQAAQQNTPQYQSAQDIETINQLGQSQNQEDLQKINEAVSRIKEQGLGAQYRGPTKLALVQGGTVSEQDIEKGKQDLESIARASGYSGGLNRNTGETSGRFALVQRLFNKPSYTRGQIGLDTSMLNLSGQANQVAKKAGQEQEAFGQQLKQAQDLSSQLVKQGQEKAQQVQQETTGGLTSKQAEIQSELERRIAEFNQSEAEREALARSGQNEFDISNLIDLTKDYETRINSPWENQLAEGKKDLSDLLSGLPKEDFYKAFGTYNKANADISNIDPSRLGTLNILNRLTGKTELTPAQQAAQRGQFGVVDEGEDAIGRQMDIIRKGVQDKQNLRTWTEDGTNDAFLALTGQLPTEAATRDRLNNLRAVGIDPDALMAKAREYASIQSGIDPNQAKLDKSGQSSGVFNDFYQRNLRDMLGGEMGLASGRLKQEQQDSITKAIQNIISRRG